MWDIKSLIVKYKEKLYTDYDVQDSLGFQKIKAYLFPCEMALKGKNRISINGKTIQEMDTRWKSFGGGSIGQQLVIWFPWSVVEWHLRLVKVSWGFIQALIPTEVFILNTLWNEFTQHSE